MQYQLLPSLSDDEYNNLKEDIKLRGVQVPVELDESGNILDGHHREMICRELGIDYPTIVRVGLSEEEKIQHVLSLNLNRRHLGKDQRIELEKELKQRGWSYRKIAETVKVSPMTVYNDLSGVQNYTPEINKTTGKDGKSYPAVFNRNKKDKNKTIKALADAPAMLLPDGFITPNEVKKKSIDDQKNNIRADMADAVHDIPDAVTVIIGDFRAALETIPDNSIDLIFTDPPYDEESIPLYGDMAAAAVRILKPGGSLITYVGNYAIGNIYNLMTNHLRYWWTVAIQHGGNSAHLIGKNIYVEWKPAMWFVKEHRGNNEYVTDMIQSTPTDKVNHDWQQSATEAAYYIEHLTRPGDTVLDPFMGSGTTLIAAYKLGRKSIGVEIDDKRANTAKARIESECRS